jgi:hypothetical protein
MVDSIKNLYAYALAEGEGVGTAYEYAAKARILQPMVARLEALGHKARFLVAGLPEKYGTSLDFAVLANRTGAELVVVDERSSAIDRARAAVGAARASGLLRELRVSYAITELTQLGGHGGHDAVLSSEVLQRVPAALRSIFAGTLRAAAPMGAVFVPNSENASHLAISGLGGLSWAELGRDFQDGHLAYVDMPPFPPGISRSPEQREKASSGRAEAIAMGALDAYCAGERFVPNVVKRRYAHIVCATWGA